MRRVVLDAHAFVGWFGSEDEAARTLRREYEAGALRVHVPSQFPAEVLELAASRGISADGLRRLAAEIERVDFEVRDAPTAELAVWLARGVGARHARYAALAASLEVPLVSTDPELLRVASAVAHAPS
jgi:predicted nucleic acid-binding protein